jgi:lipopolysaccharide/colanic/teichoic acid biosynthesis glycosyltransferase
MRKRRVPLLKRIFDVFVAGLGLIILSPLFALIAALIKLESEGPVFFRQERVGLGLHKFLIWKFRTMVVDAPSKGLPLTTGVDPRITRVGRILRQMKIDELPQLVNVLRGEMSLVGPRPEVSRYVEMFRADYEEILRVPPGLTDLASIKYRDEAAILVNGFDPENEYITRVLPDKIRLAKDYVRQSSFLLDVSLIAKTLKAVFLG